MSDVVQLRRGSSATTPTAAAYIGPPGELVIDTDLWAIRLHDGVTAGGHILGSTAGIGVASHVIGSGSTNTLVSLVGAITTAFWNSSSGAPKTFNIPDPSLVVDGSVLRIVDQFGDSGTNPITLVPAANTINGAASFVFANDGGTLEITADAANANWVIT